MSSLIHRIRAAGLVLDGQRILLVRHRTPGTERDWWIPPGGGLKPEDAGVLDTARREVFEETGLTATVSRIGYVNEWRQASTGIHHLEFFVPVDSFTRRAVAAACPPGRARGAIHQGTGLDRPDAARGSHRLSRLAAGALVLGRRRPRVPDDPLYRRRSRIAGQPDWVGKLRCQTLARRGSLSAARATDISFGQLSLNQSRRGRQWVITLA